MNITAIKAETAPDVDLYSEDAELNEFTDNPSPSGDGDPTLSDLYDDAIMGESTGKRRGGFDMATEELEPESSGDKTSGTGTGDREGNANPKKKFIIFVGNLTWWTSDKDIQQLVEDAGVEDFIEVKFYENRANGQSKGYCAVAVSSEDSIRRIHEKLPKREIHGRVPIVSPPTKEALRMFEAQSKTRPGNAGQGGSNMTGGSNRGAGPMPIRPAPGLERIEIGSGFPPRMMGIRGPPPPSRGPPFPMQPRHLVPPPPHSQGSPGGYFNPQRPPMLPQPMPPNYRPPPLRPHGMNMNMQPMPPRGPPQPYPNEWNGPPGVSPFPEVHGYPPPHGQPIGPAGVSGTPQPIRCLGPSSSMNGGPPPCPTPHMNPAFFPGHAPSGSHGHGSHISSHDNCSGGAPPPMYSGHGGSPNGHSHNHRSSSHSQHSHHPSRTHGSSRDSDRERRSHHHMSEAQFEELMSRNRSVSSSAISRAVSDAASGEYGSAVETLVTAISLIKQSKVGHDERCKMLVSTLQDTYEGLQKKGYELEHEHAHNHIRRERSRSRERRHSHSSRHGGRSRSRERMEHYYRSHRSRDRSHSRSPREREYREREREARERYYEERERERERFRELREARARSDSDRSRGKESDSEIHRATRH